MLARKWLRLPGRSHVTLFVWCAMALPFVLASIGLVLAMDIIGEAGSGALLSDAATLTLIFFLGAAGALLATWIHSR